MKKAIVIPLILLLGFLFSCQEPSNPVDSVNNLPDKSNISNRLSKLCGNDHFPPAFYSPSTYVSMEWCDGDGDSDEYAESVAYSWSWNATPPNTLGYNGCDGIAEGAKYLSVTKSQHYIYPKLTWNKSWSHYYVVKRKIGSGSWTTVSTITNAIGDVAGGALSYIDYSINLYGNLPDNIYYRVYNKIYDDLSYASTITYEPY